ncbi:amino acid adenylation domain-containing protein [Rhodococcus sp. NPDC058521]|uniref:amino acid adenylation domain-containing protein n=1 Tax=Rhodococcus sp. NPDC058521 TaxID=3346536 RepID=UPI00364E147C
MAGVDEYGTGMFPLTTAQRELWSAQLLDPDVPLMIGQYVDVHADIDMEALRRASNSAAIEFGSGVLRLVEVEGEPFQYVDPGLDQGIRFLDMTGFADPIEAAQKWMRTDCSTPIDLTRNHLVAAAVLHVGDQHNLWYMRAHHVALDAFAAMNMLRRIVELYDADVVGVAPPPSRSTDLRALSEVEAQYRSSPRYERDRVYWQNRLSTLPVTKGPRAAFPRRCVGVLSARCTRELEATNGPAAVLVAALAAYFAESERTPGVAFGLTTSGRTTRAVRETAGTVANIVPLVLADVAGQTREALIRLSRTELVGALRHQRYRLGDIQRDRGAPPSSPPFGPVVNVILDEFAVNVDGVPAPVTMVSSGPVRDLQINLYKGQSGALHLDLLGNTRRYSSAELESKHRVMIGFVEDFVAGAASAVPSLPLMPSSSDHTLPAPAVKIHETLLSAYEARPSRVGDECAVVFGSTRMDYEELDESSNQLARCLIRHGVGVESRVVVALPRSIDLVVAILAVVKAGGAYVPVDPAYPRQRIDYVIDDSDPVCVIADREIATGTPVVRLADASRESTAGIDPGERRGVVRPSSAAYMIYTSGSTGTPKGVVVQNSNVTALFAAADHRLDFGPDDVWTLFHSSAFDFSVWEMWGALLHGGTLLVVDFDTSRAPDEFAGLLEREGVSVLSTTPTAAAQLTTVASPRRWSTLRYVVFGGEALDLGTLGPWFAASGVEPTIVNMYGTTETTVHASLHSIDRGRARSATGYEIGCALPDSSLYLLNELLRPVDDGVAGDLYVAGPQVSRGYWRRSGLSAARFCPDPFGEPGTRMYRTGDRALRNADGSFEYLGRSDAQVQFHGYRIELSGIEAALSRHRSVHSAAVAVDGDHERLVGYVVTAGSSRPEPKVLRSFLAETLPSHEIPDILVEVDALPLTVNGKLDRCALRSVPETPLAVSSSGRVAEPRTPTEVVVCETFATALGVEHIGVDESFFDVGGNSVLAARAVNALRERGVGTVPMHWMFDDQTPASLAARIDADAGEAGHDRGSSLDPVLPIRTRGSGRPLFCIHPVVGLSWSFAALTRFVDDEVPIYGLQSPWLTEDLPPAVDISAVATRYIDEMRSVAPEGPYRLLGYCFGGTIAHEVAIQLQAAGEEIELLAMLDTFIGDSREQGPEPITVGDVLGLMGAQEQRLQPVDEFTPEDAKRLFAATPGLYGTLDDQAVDRMFQAVANSQIIGIDHVPGKYTGDLLFFTAGRDDDTGCKAVNGWESHISGSIGNIVLDCTHWHMLEAEAARTIGLELSARLGG